MYSSPSICIQVYTHVHVFFTIDNGEDVKMNGINYYEIWMTEKKKIYICDISCYDYLYPIVFNIDPFA